MLKVSFVLRRSAFLVILFSAATSYAGDLGSCSLFSQALEYLEKAGDPPVNKQEVLSANQIRDFAEGKAEFKPQPSKSWANGSTNAVENLMKQGVPYDRAVNVALRGDRDYARHFDSATGRFNFQPSSNVPLAAEDGSSRLDAIRINFVDEFGFPEKHISEEIIKDYTQAMAKIPDMELWIVANEKDLSKVQRFIDLQPENIRSRIKVAPTKKKTSVWAQDGSKPVEGERRSLVRKVPNDPLMDSSEKSQYLRYLASSEAVAKARLGANEPSALPFQGGNVVVSKHDVFVGADDVSSVMSQLGVTREAAKAAMQKEFGKPVIEVGYPVGTGQLAQNSFHIDMDMAVLQSLKPSPGSKGIAVVQSPTKFLDVLGFPPVREMTEKSFNAARVRALQQLEKKSREGPLTDAEKSLSGFLKEVRYEKVLKEEAGLEYVAKQARDAGYDVKRVPGISGEEHKEDFVTGQSFPFYNYTNVVVTGNKVMIPEYGIQSMDQNAKAIYESLGYETIPMRAPAQTICSMGGIRCVSETYRKPSSPGSR